MFHTENNRLSSNSLLMLITLQTQDGLEGQHNWCCLEATLDMVLKDCSWWFLEDHAVLDIQPELLDLNVHPSLLSYLLGSTNSYFFVCFGLGATLSSSQAHFKLCMQGSSLAVLGAGLHSLLYCLSSHTNKIFQTRLYQDYITLVFIFFFFLLFLCHTWLCSGFTPGFVLRDHSCWPQGTLKGWQGLNPGQPNARQAPLPAVTKSTHSSPK